MHLQIKNRPKCLFIAKVSSSVEEDRSDIGKWDSVRREFLVRVFEDNPGSLVSASNYVFEDNDIGQPTSKISSEENKTTLVLSHEKWTLDELDKVAASSQFELGEAWMLADPLTSARDVDDFWRFADALNAVDFDPDGKSMNIEAVGCLGDGDWMVWTNPDEKVGPVLAAVRELCEKRSLRVEEK